MKFFTNKSIWSKIIIVLIFVLVFEFIITKPTLGSEVTDNIVEGGGKLLTPVLSLVVSLGDAIVTIMQSAIMGVDESIMPVDVDASIWEILGSILVVAVAVVAAVATVVGLIVSGAGVFAIIAGIAKGILGVGVTAWLGPKVVSVAVSTGSAKMSKVSASNFPEDTKVPKTLYLPVFSYSPEEIFQGKILLFNVDFFGTPIEIKQDSDGSYYYEDDNGNKVITSRQNIAADLSSTISRWYVGIRNIALVAMMIVLLYIGIRMLISTLASDKAKYRQLLQDWIIGLLLLFLMHYIMAFSVTLVQKLTDIVSASIDENAFAVKFPVDDNGKIVEWFNENDMTYMLYDENGNCLGNEDGTQDVNKDDVSFVLYPTNLLGKLRLDLQFDTGGWGYVGYTICYLVLVFFTIYFTFQYLRRVLYMAFLTLIAPMVAVTYPIDKINDGSAQGFTKWFREYIFNLLIQPMHLLLYYILVTSAFDLAGSNVIYSIVAIGFMLPAEKLLRSLFGFEKASTPSALNGAAGAALVMGGLSKLSSLGGKPKGGGNKAISSKSGGSGGSGGDSDDGGSVRQVSLDGDVDATQTMAGTALPSVDEEQGSIDEERENIGEDQAALDDLRKEASTQTDKNYLDEEQAKLDARKAEADERQTKLDDRTPEALKAADTAETAHYGKDAMKDRAKKKVSAPKRVMKRTYVAAAAHKEQMLRAASKVASAQSRIAGVGAGIAGGAIGAAVGIASGDPSDIVQNTAAGAGAGYMAGKGITNVDPIMTQAQQRTTNLDKEQYYRQLAQDDKYKDYAEQQLVKMKKKEYKKALKDNGFTKQERDKMEEDGTINRYIVNDVSAKNAATAELMRKDDSSITQERAIADAKYSERIGDKYKGPDRKKWQEHFAGEFKEKANLSEEQAQAASKETMRGIERFNKYKKKTK